MLVEIIRETRVAGRVVKVGEKIDVPDDALILLGKAKLAPPPQSAPLVDAGDADEPVKKKVTRRPRKRKTREIK